MTDIRIKNYTLLPQHKGRKSIPFINESRKKIADIIHGRSDKFLVIVGPCSIHDMHTAKDYATQLKSLSESLHNIYIVMRCYFEKPRTVNGWKGYIMDPLLDGGHDIHKGLDMAIELLEFCTSIELPLGCEFLDTIIPQYISDYISWGAIGARTVESQIHRQLVSGLSMPCGFKNGTSGNFKIAIDAVESAQEGHTFPGIYINGEPAAVTTTGNKDTSIILRGGRDDTNYSMHHIDRAGDDMHNRLSRKSVIVDCSHGNSRKKEENQIKVAHSVVRSKNMGHDVVGIMIESNIYGGKVTYNIGDDIPYGYSITDPCLSFEETRQLLYTLDALLNE